MIDPKKVDGITHLSQFSWPSLPTCVVGQIKDLLLLHDFLLENISVKLWFLRGLQPIPDRYTTPSKVLHFDELFFLSKNLKNKIPFCVQPYIDPYVSGITLLRNRKVLIEFASGGTDILKGRDLPNRCTMSFVNGSWLIEELQFADQKTGEMLIGNVIEAVNVIPEQEIAGRQSVLTEWVSTLDGQIYYVDYQLMSEKFLQNYSPLDRCPKIISPGNFDFPKYDLDHSLPLDEDFILVSDMPHIEIVKFSSGTKKIKGLLIKRGAWMSHVSRFAHDTNLPCLFNFQKEPKKNT